MSWGLLAGRAGSRLWAWSVFFPDFTRGEKGACSKVHVKPKLPESSARSEISLSFPRGNSEGGWLWMSTQSGFGARKEV